MQLLQSLKVKVEGNVLVIKFILQWECRQYKTVTLNYELCVDIFFDITEKYCEEIF